MIQVAIHHNRDLAQSYEAVRARTQSLAGLLSPEDCLVQSMPDASPVKWHLAHTSWFFETMILSKFAAYKQFDPRFAFLFNSYYESLGPRHARPRRGLITRPDLDEIYRYRAHVDTAMRAACNEESLRPSITLGLHHEQQHQELILTDIKHAFFSNPMLPSYCNDYEKAPDAGCLEWQSHPGGLVRIGRDFKTNQDGFVFDNEGPEHTVLLKPYFIANRPVINREYQAFIEDGGYRCAQYWMSDGWARVEEEGWRAPLYWLKDDDGRSSLFTLSGVRPLDPDAPVEHVSFYEAYAYASWARARLPTEFEWEAACGRFDYGRVWEWTRSSYDPYPGFRPFEGALGEYNGKFMVGQMVLRGGSIASAPGHIRPTYRNFFPPQARWQFSGIRLAKDP